MTELRVIDLDTTDAAWNLAAEQTVFDCLPRDLSYFMLWQNRSAVVIGKYQNALAEIDLPYVEENGIQVVRRLSGGGAVYHDLGNLNFTFITDAGDAETLDMRVFCAPVLRTLESLGVRAELNGRNDMTIDGRKFSGNSQYLRGGRIMHHGTILFDSRLDVVERALRVDPEKIRAKGAASVRSRVTNVRPYLREDVELAEFRALLRENILRGNPGAPRAFTDAEQKRIEELTRERYASWDWTFGASPPCTILKKRRFEGCGTVEAHLDVEHGVIRAAAFLGDFISAGGPEPLAARLVGRKPEPEDLAAALEGFDVPRCIRGLDRSMLLALLCG